jgi:hypothetical protein
LKVRNAVAVISKLHVIYEVQSRSTVGGSVCSAMLARMIDALGLTASAQRRLKVVDRSAKQVRLVAGIHVIDQRGVCPNPLNAIDRAIAHRIDASKGI